MLSNSIRITSSFCCLLAFVCNFSSFAIADDTAERFGDHTSPINELGSNENHFSSYLASRISDVFNVENHIPTNQYLRGGKETSIANTLDDAYKPDSSVATEEATQNKLHQFSLDNGANGRALGSRSRSRSSRSGSRRHRYKYGYGRGYGRGYYGRYYGRGYYGHGRRGYYGRGRRGYGYGGYGRGRRGGY